VFACVHTCVFVYTAHAHLKLQRHNLPFRLLPPPHSRLQRLFSMRKKGRKRRGENRKHETQNTKQKTENVNRETRGHNICNKAHTTNQQQEISQHIKHKTPFLTSNLKQNPNPCTINPNLTTINLKSQSVNSKRPRGVNSKTAPYVPPSPHGTCPDFLLLQQQQQQQQQQH